MKNKIGSLFLITGFLFLTSVLIYSCKKEKTVTPNQEVSLFAAKTGSYFITNSTETVFKIPVGLTAVPNADRTIQFSVSSPSGAVEGQQYTLGTTSITIPAGQLVDTIDLKGIFNGYPTGRKDTLIFKITGGDIPALIGSDVFTVILQKYCDVNISSFVGVYDNCFDDGSYGPYTIEVLSATTTSGTTGYLMIDNLWDAGGSTPIRVNIDWTDPANFKTTIPTGQPLYIDGTYGQAFVRPVSTGLFSSCDNTFKLSYQVYVNAGNFAASVTTMER